MSPDAPVIINGKVSELKELRHGASKSRSICQAEAGQRCVVGIVAKD